MRFSNNFSTRRFVFVRCHGLTILHMATYLFEGTASRANNLFNNKLHIEKDSWLGRLSSQVPPCGSPDLDPPTMCWETWDWRGRSGIGRRRPNPRRRGGGEKRSWRSEGRRRSSSPDVGRRKSPRRRWRARGRRRRKEKGRGVEETGWRSWSRRKTNENTSVQDALSTHFEQIFGSHKSNHGHDSSVALWRIPHRQDPLRRWQGVQRHVQEMVHRKRHLPLNHRRRWLQRQR